MQKILGLLGDLYNFVMMLLMSVTSTSLLPAIYLIKSSYVIVDWGQKYTMLINAVLYLVVVFVLSLLSLLWINFRARDSINNDTIEIKPVNNEYLPIYLGYIFVSLSIPNPDSGQIDAALLAIIYLMICLFVTCSKSLCFNPMFVIFGYGYYLVNTASNTKVFVITKRKIGKNSSNISFPHLRKINEIVYFDKDK